MHTPLILSRAAAKDLGSSQSLSTMRAYVYILASHSRTIYVGVTRDLIRRLAQHRDLTRSRAFTARYRITKLVYFEITESLMTAVTREKQLKGWRRDRKIALIERDNPDWRDLAASWLQDGR